MSSCMDIGSMFVVIDKDLAATTVPVTDTLWAELDAQFGDFAGASLISSFLFNEDWPTWENHPHGDEFVCLLSGDAEMILATADEERVRDAKEDLRRKSSVQRDR